MRIQDRNRDEGGTTGREGLARDGGFLSQATVEHRQLCGGKRIGLRCLREAEEKFQAGLLQLAAQEPSSASSFWSVADEGRDVPAPPPGPPPPKSSKGFGF